MTLEELIKEIKNTEEDIKTAENLLKALANEDYSERCAAISCKGSWRVYFQTHEVETIIQDRLIALNNRLNQLLAAKEAAEKTAYGWLQFGKDQE